MGIRDLVKSAVVTREFDDKEVRGEKLKVPKRLNAGELLDIAAASAADKAAMRVHLCIHDEDGQQVFKSLAEARAIDWELFEPLLDLTAEIKGLEIRKAAGESKPHRS